MYILHKKLLSFHQLYFVDFFLSTTNKENQAPDLYGSMGRFYGFKLHIVVNNRGELLSFKITSDNVDDRNADVIEVLIQNLFEMLFGDREYIGKDIFKSLLKKGIKLITKLKSNMKNQLMNFGKKYS